VLRNIVFVFARIYSIVRPQSKLPSKQNIKSSMFKASFMSKIVKKKKCFKNVFFKKKRFFFDVVKLQNRKKPRKNVEAIEMCGYHHYFSNSNENAVQNNIIKCPCQMTSLVDDPCEVSEHNSFKNVNFVIWVLHAHACKSFVQWVLSSFHHSKKLATKLWWILNA